jgi:hypothetical protein
MSTLKLKPSYMNSYEAAHKILSNNPWYQESDWLSMAKSGDLDQYITVLANTDKITDKNKFYSDYNYKYADGKTRVAALYNEILADRTNSDTVRQRLMTDESGNVVLDAAGKPQYEKYTASDYDYYKSVIKSRNDEKYQEFLEQQEQERKDSMNGFVKFFADVASVGTEFVYGLSNQIDNLTNSLAAIGNGVGAAFRGENPLDAIVETNARDTWRLFEQIGVQDWIIDFESRYTDFRDLDGNYSGVGKYIGGVSSTMGQMLPSMLGGKAAGAISKGLGVGAKTVSTISQVTSTLIFYQSMTSGNIRDMYKQMAAEGVSVSSGAILANATIKSALQWGVEVGLAKVFGGTAIDSVVFGRAVSSTASKSLAAAAGKRILGDFVTEGLEEVFQETSDWLVDRAFMVLVNENFGDITSLTYQSLMDSFIIGGLASFAGSALNIGTTKKVSTGKLKLDKKGEPKVEKLSKLASWEYGLDMQSFMKNYVDIQEQGKQVLTKYGKDSKEAKQWAAAFTEMYASYRMIASIYNEIGEERFKNANEVLTKITSLINEGKFNNKSAATMAHIVMDKLSDMRENSVQRAVTELEKAGITQLADVVERGSDLAHVDVDPNTRKAIQEVFDGDKNVRRVVLTRDGANVAVVDDTLFIPISYAKNADGSTMYETIAEQTLVKAISEGKFKGAVLDTVLSTFIQVTGRKDATMEEAVYNLVFNQSFFNIMLSTANKDMYALLTSLVNIENSVISDKLRDKIYKKKIATVVENMTASLYNYCINQPNADYRLDVFTKAQIQKIAATRWCRNLYARVINNATYKKLTDADWEVLNNRVNSLPIKQSDKDKILTGLKSENKDTRTSAMNRIATMYKGIFTTNYDGKTYMPDTTVSNRTFNAWLQSLGLTIETLVSTDVDESLKRTVTELYGEFNEENLIKFRQTQFMQSCNNSFVFRFNKQGKLGVYEYETNKQVGFAEYKAETEVVIEGKNFEQRVNLERSSKRNYIVKEIINDSIDVATASYLSIDDVIVDPTLLSDDIQAKIQMEYGSVNSTSAFLYLRKYFIDKFKTTTLIVLSDGTYAFADVRPMKSLLETESFEITDKTKISDIIKNTYLQGRLKDVKVKLTDRSIVAEYNAEENTIYINKIYASRKDSYLTFAILHEFQHAIQVENGMNLGMNADWIKSTAISKTAKKEIIADVRKHRPELFEGITKGSDEEAQIVNDFVYYSSGESTAYGIDASQLVNFYPTIVNADKGVKITFPWGSSYRIDGQLAIDGQSIIGDVTSMFDKIFEQALFDKTTELTVEDWRKNIRSVFIANDGTLRTFDNNQTSHYLIMGPITKNGTVKTAVNFFDGLPEVSVQRQGLKSFVAVRVGDSMSRKSEQSLLLLMDTLYSQSIPFEVGPIYEEEDGNLVVSSDRAENSDDLLNKYNVLKVSAKRRKLGSPDTMSIKKPGETTGQKPKRYVTQREAKGTNLEKFGYTAAYKRTQMDTKLKNFIINASESIDSELWNKVKSGKITTADVMDYLRNADSIDDITFKLINDSYFKNSKIKTFAELQEKIEDSSRYYAMRAVLKSAGFGEALLTNANPNLFEGVLEIINKDPKLKKLFDEIESRYHTYKKQSLVISEKYLRKLWMEYFDGTVASGGYISAIAKIAAIANWKVTGEGSTLKSRSLSDAVGEDMTLEDVLEDTSATDAFDYILNNGDRTDKIDDIMKAILPKFVNKIKKMSPLKANRFLSLKRTELTEKLENMSDRDFIKAYKKYVEGQTEEEINKMFLKTIIVETGGIDVSKLNDQQLDQLEITANTISKKVVRPNTAIVNNIKSITRTIKANLSKKDKIRFLKDNGDVFDENLNVKKDLYQSVDERGRVRLKEASELIELENRVRQLSKSVRANDYSSEQSLRFRKKMDKELTKLRLENEKLAAKLGTTKIEAVTYEIADEVITIDTKKEVPLALRRILESEFNKVTKSKTQYLTEENDVHIQMNFKKFVSDNVDYLLALTQSDIDQIIDFYLTSEILPSTNKARQYSAIQVYLMTYIISNAKSGRFLLTDNQQADLTNRLESIISLSAANLSNWKAAMKLLKPEETLIQSAARKNGIEFPAEDVTSLVEATASGDITRILAAKKKMYDSGLKVYKGRKQSFFDKLLKFERMAMLSGPGTWIRNAASNLLVTAGNKGAEYAAGPIVSLLEKLFPKKFKHKDGQYKLVGTKVTSEVQTFIKNQVIDSGLLDLIKDGLSKYDTRKHKAKVSTKEESLADLIEEAIRSKIMNDTYSSSEIVNKTYEFLFKMLSDDKAVNLAAIKYLGKILTEDDVNLDEGLSTDVINHIADAYVMAAQDYMHKSNFFNDIEYKLRERWGDKAFFVYKQFFPFAAASWNWFVEGLNYTPVGLIKGIIQYAKLETTIEKMEDRKQRGEQVVSSRFAEYLAKRNIGKGVIGTIGFAIGAALAAFGVAGIDEEDGKYKIHVGDVYVDISDLFGSQGIILGIAVIGSAKDGDVWSLIGNSLDTMFLDSTFTDLFNSFRYSETFGEWLRDQPFSILSMFIPNLLKTLTSITYGHKVQYSKGVLGKFEKIAVQSIPGIVYAFPKQYDPYTGEKQIQYKAWFLTKFVNKLSPFDVAVYNISEQEKVAMSLGVKRGSLKGNYEIDGEKIQLSSSEIDELNKFYGRLNEKELKEFISGSKKYRVLDDKKNKYVELTYSKMTDKQKATVIDRIMSNNSSKAKIYMLTKNGSYKYYANYEEYKELKKLGINVLKETDKKKGFVKN